MPFSIKKKQKEMKNMNYNVYQTNEKKTEKERLVLVDLLI